ncbi:hypothetical protein [Bacillus smithii]|uniref:hypothetical protein n=1 Tax=Bacillus smithii TaxID=1479 RepID=UPI003D1DC93D
MIDKTIEVNKGDALICCSHLLSNFTFGKEYKVKDVSYSGNSYTIINDEGDWVGIGAAFFTTKEIFSELTEEDIKNNDNEIKKSQEEFERMLSFTHD